ncbi:hypothetical protein BH18ACT1_BH18ACT1_16470 [soil metagenome]
MGRASSSKKVARAARAAGRPGTGRNWLWPLAVFALVAIGVSLVVVSRPESQASASPGFGDHWHAAYGVATCGDFAAPFADARGDANGIHTHEDGLAHIHPSSSAATGDNANVGTFAEEVDLGVDDDRLDLPGDGDAGKAFAEGEDECDGEPGIVQAAVWENPGDEEAEIVTEGIADLKFEDGSIVTLAFAPEGADIAKPPTAQRLEDATAAEEGRPLVPVEGVPEPTPTTLPADTSTTAPEDVTPSTAPSDGSTTTSAPPDSTTTPAP